MNRRLLLPLRVPELGPSLGRLVAGTSARGGSLPLDGVRYRLATRIFEGAGEARCLAAGDERAAALAAIGRATWQAAWDEAVMGVAEMLVHRVASHLEAEARAVRMGPRRRARLPFDAKERRALAARLGSAGAELMPALDSLDRLSAGALNATGLEPDAVANWQDALKLAARRLEAAWLALVDTVETELVRCMAAADEVARWRKPMWPVGVGGGAAMVLALWLGLVFGGYLEAPDWLARIWQVVSGK